jgi:signal transduction histidine kinase
MVKRLEERAEELESAWQEAENANQLKSEFLATMSHELRTPLNAIIGCVRLVRDGCCDDRDEEIDFLKRADEAAIHLLNIINDLLDIAKIEAGTLSIFPEAVDLKRILQEVIDLQVVPIQQKKLDLVRSDLADSLLVQADPAKLKQVLLNVLCNAVKFTDEGGIAIATRLEWIPDTQSEAAPMTACAVVTIQDTGIGIDPAQQSKLFRPFVMADGTTTRRFEGTGLGLAISRNLMQLMGGNIVLYSAGAGQGTTVEVTLPLMEQPAQEPEHGVNPAIDAGYYQAIGPAAAISEVNP